MNDAQQPAGAAPIATTAFNAFSSGLSIIPIRHGSKSPAVPWKDYQERLPTIQEVIQWFKTPQNGLAVVCGNVSGNLEMTEIEGAAQDCLDNILTRLEDQAPLVLQKIRKWCERSPSGGYHWFYRLELPEGEKMPVNTKIASGADKSTLAETRGQGGYSVIAPTPGSFHPATGKPWQTVTGSPQTVPTLTLSERQQLHTVLWEVLNEHPSIRKPGTNEKPAPIENYKPQPIKTDGAKSPLDDWATRNDLANELQKAGWTPCGHDSSGGRVFTRPGKNPKDGPSAILHGEPGEQVLSVFTTSTDFEENTSGGQAYSAARALAVLRYGSDSTENMQSLTKELRKEGYGEELKAEYLNLSDVFTPGKLSPDYASATSTSSEMQPIEKETDQLVEGVLENTEMANAVIFSHAYQHEIRYTPERKEVNWYVWDGQQWAPNEENTVKRKASEIVRQLPADKPPQIKHKQRSQTARGINAILSLASSMPELRVSQNDFDVNTHELNTPAGIVDLTTGQIMAHDPAKMHTKITKFSPPANGYTPGRWADFIKATFTPEIADYMQEVVGVSLFGEVKEHVFIFAYGHGANGKSVFFETIYEVLGDYATSIPSETLMKRQFGGREAALEVEPLIGRRFAFASECNSTDNLNPERIKLLTGGDSLQVRKLYGQATVVHPSHTLFLAGNHFPLLPDSDPAIWRRIRCIPFDKTVPPGQQDPELKKKLVRDHGQEVLGWAIEGARRYYQRGQKLITPAEVLTATRKYELAVDPFAGFLANWCTIGPGQSVAATDFKQAFAQYARENDLPDEWKKGYLDRLKREHNVKSEKGTRGMYFYRGVGLLLSHQRKEPEA